MSGKYIAAVCQMDSQADKQENLRIAAEMIREAAAKGAKVITFPENMNFIGKGYRYQAEEVPGMTTDFFCEQARKYSVWLVSGSFPERTEDEKPKNTVVLIDPMGHIRCRYSKLHMFDVDIPDGESYKESGYSTPGQELVVTDTELGCLGLAICYDLRFGELFRLLALNGAKVIFLPSNFNVNTGEAHWEHLLRARAIENGIYIIAPNQTGKKVNSVAYGNSMIIDPWGRVIARAGDEPCTIMADIDLDCVDETRRCIPSLENRRSDMYQLIGCVSRFS